MIQFLTVLFNRGHNRSSMEDKQYMMKGIGENFPNSSGADYQEREIGTGGVQSSVFYPTFNE